MNHPDELLAPYVDGSLSEEERADVSRHLERCARCSQEAGLASGARAAIRSIPDAIPPADLSEAAIEAAERNARPEATTVVPLPRPVDRPGWVRWATAAAGVAAAVIVASVVLPHIGTESSKDATRAAAAPAAEAVPQASAVEVQDADYDTPALEKLALAYRPAGAPSVPVAQETGGGVGTFGPSEAAPPRLAAVGVGAATACLSKAFGQPKGTLVRLIQARYQGMPVFIGVYLASPGAGQPPNTAIADVAAIHDCSVVTHTQVLL
jgi:Putative zinc-finger